MRVKVLKMNIKTDQTKENERYGLEDEFKDVLEEERMRGIGLEDEYEVELEGGE